jgi:hypothetical protein
MHRSHLGRAASRQEFPPGLLWIPGRPRAPKVLVRLDTGVPRHIRSVPVNHSVYDGDGSRMPHSSAVGTARLAMV